MQKGVSIIICCYNSATRLTETLRHLALQKVPEYIPWEIIVINNASKDDTSQAAKRIWRDLSANISFQVLEQPTPGKSYALDLGFNTARFEYLLICDDDNWLNEHFVRIAFEVMESHPYIGALGGNIEAVCEVAPPEWFTTFQEAYAVGKQGEIAGDITTQRRHLWGAGCIIRRTAWRNLKKGGFQSLLTCRKGDVLSSGGDSELCLALQISGWKLWYEPHLQMKHFIPANRLQWSYLRKLYYSFGASDTWKEGYLQFMDPKRNNWKGRLRKYWQFRLVGDIKNIIPYFFQYFTYQHLHEGNPKILYLETLLGRVNELFKAKKVYNHSFRDIQNAAWLKKPFTLDAAFERRENTHAHQ